MPKLMIIDDAVSLTKYYAGIARQIGFDVDIVNDSEEALSRCVACAPDVVILDIIMPGKDGFEVLEELQSLPSPPPIIVISGYGDSCLRFAAVGSRMHSRELAAVMRKPLRKADLEDALLRAVGKPSRSELAC